VEAVLALPHLELRGLMACRRIMKMWQKCGPISSVCAKLRDELRVQLGEEFCRCFPWECHTIGSSDRRGRDRNPCRDGAFRGTDNGLVPVQITEKDGAVSFAVRVQPRASRDEIAGEWQHALKIRLTAHQWTTARMRLCGGCWRSV